MKGLKHILNTEPVEKTVSEKSIQDDEPKHPERKIKLTENWTENDVSVMCPYKNRPRMIHPAVCEWHREENDSECIKMKCSRLNLGRKKIRNETA